MGVEVLDLRPRLGFRLCAGGLLRVLAPCILSAVLTYGFPSITL